ncbi:hypothetical protein CYMTET_19885 [Cymbomonas tetramitiformis]|uniref:Uncharacterized protein n=1 Tax=Cymbomonas tetramitiformis TaxID=36881 RepID=A0AAE0L4S4_9CHLO|nr:hypothetical protein CYMTET_19885 [Cymbomonas tetramitiformis]
MVSEGLDEDLRYAPSEKRLSDGPNEFAAYRMMNDVEQTRAEDFVPLSELSKTALGASVLVRQLALRVGIAYACSDCTGYYGLHVGPATLQYLFRPRRIVICVVYQHSAIADQKRVGVYL